MRRHAGMLKGGKGMFIIHVFLKRASAVLDVQTHFDPRKQKVVKDWISGYEIFNAGHSVSLPLTRTFPPCY